MKKIILICLLSTAFALNIHSQSLGINIMSSNLCANSNAYASVSSTAVGATSYSWTINAMSCSATQTPATNGLTTFITYPCCGVFTISCSAMNGTTFISSVVNTVNVSCSTASAVTISSSSNGSICSSSSATLSSTGNVTYTWIPGGINGANVVVSPSANVCYTVLANNFQGCFNMSASYCMSVIPTYSIAAIGNTAVCLGNSVNLGLSGGPSFITNPGGIVSPTPILTPSVSTLYTISCPSGAYPCPSSTVIPIIVNPIPTISVANGGASSNTLCAGKSATLFALGNVVSYTWSTFANTSSIIVTPSANTCYSVAGYSSLGCLNMAVYCFSVLPSPSLTINGNNTVCLGSSSTFSVSGANTYTWASNSSNANTLNVLPNSTLQVSGNVYGTGNNGCSSFTSYSLNALNTCALVWPGDANRDGQVSNLDVLELGLAASSTGAARSSTSNAWAAQFANAWSGTVSTGWNLAHADCNGDGTINSADNTAILSNFSFTHAFKPMHSSANPDIHLFSANANAYEGQWNKVEIQVGDVGSPLNSLYGLAFELNYDKSLIETDSVKLNYLNSSLSSGNQNINFQKAIFVNGKEYAATVRTDHTNAVVNGSIAEFWFKLKSGLPANSNINLSISGAQKVNATGSLLNLSTDAGVNLTISKNTTGIAGYHQDQNFVQFYPNPSNGELILQSDLTTRIPYSIFDLSGRKVISGEFIGFKKLQLNDLKEGTYLIKFESESGQMLNRLIILN